MSEVYIFKDSDYSLSDEIQLWMEKCSDEFRRSFLTEAENCFLIYSITKKILDKYYIHCRKVPEKILDMKHFAGCLSFPVYRENLNRGRKKNLGLILGRIEKNEDECYIFLEQEDIITEQQERYAIAYLLGYYFMQKNLSGSIFMECAEVRIPQTLAEFNASIFAAFLLLQPKKFFEKVKEYVEKASRPINQEIFLLEMSKLFKVPYHFTIVSYEYLKVIAGLYRNEKFRDQIQERFKDVQIASEAIDMLFKSVLLEDKLLPDEFFY